MKALLLCWDKWRRRRFGTYVLDDPRPIASGAPYTYFLPSENELLALAIGDLVKLIFSGNPTGRTYEAERMWVKITAISGDHLTGTLENIPFDLHQLRLGDVISFDRNYAIDTLWSEDRIVAPPPTPPRQEYWDRCMVDRCVVDGAVPVYYLYREEPDLAAEDDKYPDSGWRIRGDYRGLSDEELATWDQEYIALGKVLNEDDSWLHLLDSPVGSAFVRDNQTNMFVPDPD